MRQRASARRSAPISKRLNNYSLIEWDLRERNSSRLLSVRISAHASPLRAFRGAKHFFSKTLR